MDVSSRVSNQHVDHGENTVAFMLVPPKHDMWRNVEQRANSCILKAQVDIIYKNDDFANASKKVTATLGPRGGMSQTESVMLFEIHSTKCEEFFLHAKHLWKTFMKTHLVCQHEVPAAHQSTGKQNDIFQTH